MGVGAARLVEDDRRLLRPLGFYHCFGNYDFYNYTVLCCMHRHFSGLGTRFFYQCIGLCFLGRGPVFFEYQGSFAIQQLKADSAGEFSFPERCFDFRGGQCDALDWPSGEEPA